MEVENFIIVDLESNFKNFDKDPKKKNFKNKNEYFEKEIIEIGAVKVNKNLEIIDEFNVFVKPKINTRLTPECKELTTIRQLDINNAETFDVVLEDFKKWIGNEPYLLCSWGKFDKNRFNRECELYGLDDSWTKNHISLKHQFSKIKNIELGRCGMGSALRILKIKLDGTHHRGIDDAKNIVKIFIKLHDKWEY